MIEYRITFEEEPEPDKSWLDQPEFRDEDPNHHLMVAAAVEYRLGRRVENSTRDVEWGPWGTIASVGNIDTIISGEKADPFELGTFPCDSSPLVPDLPFGYQQDLAAELLREAREKVEGMIREARSNCDLTGEGSLDLSGQIELMRAAIQRRDSEVRTDFGVHGIEYGFDDSMAVYFEDPSEYAIVGFVLPGGVYAEIENGTYGTLNGLRFYLNEDEQVDDPDNPPDGRGAFPDRLRRGNLGLGDVSGMTGHFHEEWGFHSEELPRCAACNVQGALVETITDQVVWHHEDPRIEDQHDFEPRDGRSTIVQPGTMD